MASMPLALIAASLAMKPGRWFLWQVGVKAPGRPNRTTFLPLKNSPVVTGRGPSLVMRRNVASGRESPILIVMRTSSGVNAGVGESAASRLGPCCIANGGAGANSELGAWAQIQGRLHRPLPAGDCETGGDWQRRVGRLLHQGEVKAIAGPLALDVEPPGLRRLDERVAGRAGL